MYKQIISGYYYESSGIQIVPILSQIPSTERVIHSSVQSRGTHSPAHEKLCMFFLLVVRFWSLWTSVTFEAVDILASL